ncbi:hypothetical protein [Sphingobium bisphenolivorans]|uniref:hypothetical protein n=1 Tax=Sphingobium bisphenolivorans TaxID=1335760 RepID=UPI0003A14AB1|nr:hypothetical protein [Sphingobium bisphenolivorans]
MIYEGQQLSGNVELDGNRFIKCRFEHATLIYRGGEPPQLSECVFDPAQIEFQNAAANTVRLLGAMAQPNSGLRYLAARMFWQILGDGNKPQGVAGAATEEGA